LGERDCRCGAGVSATACTLGGLSAVFSTQPCLVAGTRSLNIPSDMSTTVSLVDFTWNGMYPQSVYMYTGAGGGDDGGGGGEYY
jgi:hypothetical protein